MTDWPRFNVDNEVDENSLEGDWCKIKVNRVIRSDNCLVQNAELAMRKVKILCLSNFAIDPSCVIKIPDGNL